MNLSYPMPSLNERNQMTAVHVEEEFIRMYPPSDAPFASLSLYPPSTIPIHKGTRFPSPFLLTNYEQMKYISIVL
ncbi:hypothetical protein J2Z48_001566 [Croceifilum oryzae]|uniref:Uncharacterized protein n=1 Tax=Croceifilum oryzae TaxID=1553429 RepID=A0AAJ1TEI0_9BACL|nr:hypothetical protein [Croceifilum oryzae]